ncbi:hypothetical protein SHKM778_08100 [Streptomyces sp. KM77-8]|uniref:DUF3631 domain-containing protein n=1 Tax=Streptomyces haneummycinicus TaxID=3074435 RepID=A0AAT9HAK7_9ACTN
MEPLLAVADAVGGHWPDRARAACVALVRASKANDKGSLGVRLLTDLRDHVMVGIDRLPTIAIIDRLNALDDAPWADLNGKPLDNRRLSRMLGEYMTADNEPIASRNIKTAGSVLKGYYATDLHDAWQRYCPLPGKSATSATGHRKRRLTSHNGVAATGADCRYPPLPLPLPATSDRPLTCTVAAVAEVAALREGPEGLPGGIAT